MAVDSIAKIKKDIKQRIKSDLNCSLSFYIGYITAMYVADIINSFEEYDLLFDWVGSLYKKEEKRGKI